MTNSDRIYIDLQQHLDKQAVGFPATKSGVEICILKELFTPEQASIALHLNYQPQSAQDVFSQVNNGNLSLEKVQNMLEAMVSNGAIGCTLKNNCDHYFTVPLFLGITALHRKNATPQFRKDFKEYFKGDFGKVYTNMKTSQLRTIPIEKSIPANYHIATYDQIREIINNTHGPIAIGKCNCREHAKQRGQTCKVTKRLDTCMAFDDWASHFIKQEIFREIPREEALKITRQNEEDGLILQPSNYQKVDLVCACCGCCCAILAIQKSLPHPAENWAHNFFAAVKNDNCTGCGICVDKCQMDAIRINEASCSAINLERCIGCGICVVTCPSNAMTLVKKEKEISPPKDSASLYKILAEK